LSFSFLVRCLISVIVCNFLLVFASCFLSFSLVLVPRLIFGLSGYYDGDLASSYVPLCCVSDVKINVICSDQIYHGNLLRQVKDVEETQDPDPSKEVVCVVTGNDYLWWVRDFSVKGELSLAARVIESLSSVDLIFVSACVLLILPVVLLIWVVGLILKFVWLKKGDDLLWRNWYPKFDILFSGEFGKMEFIFGLQQYILLEEKILRSLKKKNLPSCGSCITDPNSPVCMRGVTVTVSFRVTVTVR